MIYRFLTGIQWGDEGKGGITDLFCSLKPTVGVRFQGGPNAGHTLYNNSHKRVLHQVPSSVVSENSLSFIGNGCVIDPVALLEEIEELRSTGLTITPSNLVISDRAHIISPYHIAKDKLLYQEKFGTTGKGIGPCYESKYKRNGIRFTDFINSLLDKESVEDRLEASPEEIAYVNDNGLWEKFRVSVLTVLSYVKDVPPLLARIKSSGAYQILFEGAQGFGLDIDHGDYPFISTSNSSIGGAYTGSGIFLDFHQRIGVFKAYSTKVGEGPFLSHDIFPFDDEIRGKGEEFGATTGRPRKCGWLDCAQIKRSMLVNGLSHLIMTKLDVLTGLPYVGFCYPVTGGVLVRTMNGWTQDIRGAKTMDSLAVECLEFVKAIENVLDAPISLLGTGPDREDYILRDESLMV